MKLYLQETTDVYTIFDLYDEELEKEVGSVEVIFDDNEIFMENIYRADKYRGRNYLPQVIEKLKSFQRSIRCVPCVQYRNYYKELGFTTEDGEYFSLQVNT